MSYTIVLRVDNDDEADSDPLKAVWVIDHYETAEEAIAEAEDICAQEYARTGVEPSRVYDQEHDDCDIPVLHFHPGI